MEAMTTWIDARYDNPPEGYPVLAAVSGRHPADDGDAPSAEQDFWMVVPMHFEGIHLVQGTDQSIRDC